MGSNMAEQHPVGGGGARLAPRGVPGLGRRSQAEAIAAQLAQEGREEVARTLHCGSARTRLARLYTTSAPRLARALSAGERARGGGGLTVVLRAQEAVQGPAQQP